MNKSKVLIILFVLILVFSSISSNTYATMQNPNIIIKSLPTPVIDFIDTYNFHKVDNNYYRGGQPDENDYKDFAVLGIKTIVNLRNTDKEENDKQEILAGRYGIKYINIPMKPSQPPTPDQVSYFLRLFKNQNNLPVYVHCWQGKDRTGIMTALYRVKGYGWNFDQAYSEMKDRGYHSFIYPKHKEFLQNYTRNFVISKNS